MGKDIVREFADTVFTRIGEGFRKVGDQTREGLGSFERDHSLRWRTFGLRNVACNLK